MKSTAIIASLLVLGTSPSFAADFNGAKAACADAIAEQLNRSLDGAHTKLVKARDGGTLRLTVKVTFDDGAAATGECRVRRGEVTSLVLEKV